MAPGAAAAVTKPNRSEDLMSLQEQQRIAEEVRHQFDSAAPKRHRKPRRSDLGEGDFDSYEDNEDCDQIPEYAKFQALSHSSETVKYNSDPSTITEEFVETEYYADLNSVDKSLHHTTGSGFIQVNVKSNQDISYGEPASSGLIRTKSQSNPATNDWIPSPARDCVDTSDKPHRSEP